MNNLQMLWKKTKLWQQILIVGVILSIILFSFIGMKPDTYQILYSNLEQSDSFDIQNELSKMGTKYKVSADGMTISVDGAEIPRIKSKLASMGLPSAGDPGFELFDENSLGATKFDKERKYERALIGELQRGLVQGFDFIEKSIVKLSFSMEDKLFAENTQSKAAVTVHTKRNSELNQQQIKSIKHFVASSVRDLKPEDVDVMDKNGIIYETDGFKVGTASGYTKQMEIVKETQRGIHNDIMKTLATIFGAENVTLNVRVDINFDEIVRNIEKYDPEGTLVSRQSRLENIEKEEGISSQEPGSDNNGDVPDYEINDENRVATYNQDKEEIIENFEVGRTVETIKENPELSKIFVTAVINKAIDEDKKIDFVQKWEKVIANASGVELDVEGSFINGNIVVESTVYEPENKNDPYGDLDNGEDLKAAEKGEKIVVMMFVFGGLGVLLLILFAWFMYRKREEVEYEEFIDKNGKKKVRRTELPEKDNRTNDEQLNSENNDNSSNDKNGMQNSKQLMQQIGQKQSTKTLFEENQELSEAQEKLAEKAKEIAEENPERTADFIKKMISEG